MKKMYILVRKDLDEYGQSYKYVQGMHAAMEYADWYGLEEWKTTLVVLGVKNLYHLRKWHDKLEDADERHKAFTEPDLGDEMTSIACWSDGKIFKSLNLIGESDGTRKTRLQSISRSREQNTGG